jgi:replicative DNA helicase
MLVKWADDVSMSSEIDKVVRDTYARRYAYGCNDEIMSRFCSRHCSFHHNKGSTMDFESTADLQEHLREYIEKLQIGNLIDIGTKYGAYEPYNIVPGELVVLTADTGIGKSMLVQDIILDTEKNTLYLNLEMNKHLLYRRMLQTKLNKTKEEINEMVISGQISPDVASNVKMHSDAITIDDIKQAVIHLRPEILVVDTTDGINVKEAGNNDLFKMGKILEGLRSIAQKQNIIVICVHHLNKSGAKETQGIVNMKGEKIAREIQLTDLVGKQDIVTKVDHVLALEGDRSTGLRKLRSMKSRDSAPLDVELEFDFEKQQVRSARRDIDIDELKKVFDETGNIYE